MLLLRSSWKFLAAAVAATSVLAIVNAQDCIPSNKDINDFFKVAEPTCCQNDVCAIPCPVDVSDPSSGYGIAIIIAIVLSFLIGMATLILVHGKAENFFVAGRSLPLWIVAMTLGAQSIDSNSILGNADLSYKYHFYDGAVLPIGLGLSLILNALFLARHINQENVLTLPDVLAKRYGPIVEIFATICSIVSFLMLLAGNLVGMGVILGYVWQISEEAGIWTAAAIIWAYTASGGLFSVAYTDVVQGIIGWSGCIVTAFYMITNEDPNAPPPSIGFEGYIYPDNIGDGGICDMYQGVPCSDLNPGACCYNVDLWCPPNGDSCRADNGAYPFGDKRVFNNQMGYFRALTPFPNALFWNWATIFILGFGNLAALDFQARCMAAKTPRIATWGCVLGGLFTFFVGIPFSYMGSITRLYYGPDAPTAEFEADSCNPLLGLPTCALWLPDATAFIKLMTHQAPAFLGGWCLFGIVAASMSTADGAILAMGTVTAHNLVRQLDPWFPGLITADNLLNVARIATVPFTLAAALIGGYYRSDHPSGATGYLLIVAFDVMMATVVVPLFGCFYAKAPRPNAALLSMLAGAFVRILLEFVLPKDGYLLLPYDVPEFYDVGPAASDAYPTFVDDSPQWNMTAQPCNQRQFEDFTGVDSLSAFVTAILVFLAVQWIENGLLQGQSMFTIPGMEPYDKILMDEEEGEGEADGDVMDESKGAKTTKTEDPDVSGKVPSSGEEENSSGDENGKAVEEVSA